MSTYASLPVDSAVVVPADLNDPLARKIPKLKLGWDLMKWLSGLRAEVDARPKRGAQENLTGLDASVAVTPLALGTVTQGVWRVNYTVRVTRAATVSSSIQVTITWTERAVTQSETGTLVNGNLTTSREGKPLVIRTDAATPISYSTVYASVGGVPMLYSLDLVAEELASDLA